jgi:secreted trypsin-like serine protease
MTRRLLPATLLLALALAPAASARPAPPKAAASIVGGHAAAISSWPSIAYLAAGWDGDGDGQIESIASCTGSVIAPRWILSAAHCAFRPDGQGVDAMVAVTGVADVNDQTAEAIGADQLVVDPDWNPNTLSGDALLIHLKAASARPPIALPVPGGQYVTKPNVPNAAGWGTIDEDSKVGTDVLQEAYLALQEDDTCAAFAPGFDPGTQTCAGTPKTAGACHGDSGGPLIVFDKTSGKPVLWGLTSFGPQLDLGMKPCELNAPAIYSWVPGFSDFISQHIGGAGPAPTPTPTPIGPSHPSGPSPAPRPSPGVITPAPDRVAPQLTHAKLSSRRFAMRRAATLSFDLSEAAAVRITVLKKVGGRYTSLAAPSPLAAPAGHTARRLSAKLTRKALKPGRYRLRLDAADTAGNAAPGVNLDFTVIR